MAGVRDRDRCLDRVVKAFIKRGHGGGRLQMPFGVGGKQMTGLVDCRQVAGAGQHVLQRAAARRMIEHIVGGDERTCGLRCASSASAAIRARSSPLVAVRGGEMQRRACIRKSLPEALQILTELAMDAALAP